MCRYPHYWHRQFDQCCIIHKSNHLFTCTHHPSFLKMPIQWSVIILITTLSLLHFRDLPLKQSNHNEQYELLLGNRILARTRIYTSKTNCNHKSIQCKLISQLLLILSGDIHQHPGPMKYPCGMTPCGKQSSCTSVKIVTFGVT